MIQVKPPLKIRVRSYDKLFLDKLNASDYWFAVNNAIVIDKEIYLDHWIGEASNKYRKAFL